MCYLDGFLGVFFYDYDETVIWLECLLCGYLESIQKENISENDEPPVLRTDGSIPTKLSLFYSVNINKKLPNMNARLRIHKLSDSQRNYKIC